jgi:hypothetical protein
MQVAAKWLSPPPLPPAKRSADGIRQHQKISKTGPNHSFSLKAQQVYVTAILQGISREK